MKKFLTFIGSIAAGKGTQASIISKKYGYFHMSIGKMFRDEIKSQSVLGVKVKNLIENGYLVPDALTNDLVNATFKKIDLSKGFILDGYPRTINQAKVLDEMLSIFDIKLDAAIMLDVSDEETIIRVTGRFACPSCGFNYHDSFKKPLVKGVCDNCGFTSFVRRSDDKEEVVKTRIANYKTEIEPIIKYYEDQKKIIRVDANTHVISDVTKTIVKAIS